MLYIHSACTVQGNAELLNTDYYIYIYKYKCVCMNFIQSLWWFLNLLNHWNWSFLYVFPTVQKKQRTKELSQLFHSYNPYDHKVRRLSVGLYSSLRHSELQWILPVFKGRRVNIQSQSGPNQKPQFDTKVMVNVANTAHQQSSSRTANVFLFHC